MLKSISIFECQIKIDNIVKKLKAFGPKDVICTKETFNFRGVESFGVILKDLKIFAKTLFKKIS